MSASTSSRDKAVSRICENLVADIRDRSGLKWEWHKIDSETINEIRSDWETIIRREIDNHDKRNARTGGTEVRHD